MLDSLILLKLAALGCFSIIFIAIASFLRWTEEESYKNEDGLETSTGMINGLENKGRLLLPMYLSSTPSLPHEMQRPEVEESKQGTNLDEQTCEENSSAFHGTCTISNEPDSKTDLGLVTMKRFHVSHTSAKQTPPVEELVNLAQQCLSLYGCKGNIRCHTGISGDLIIGISLIVPNDKEIQYLSDEKINRYK